MGLSELLVWLFATELAIINNYVFNNIWTFKDSEIKGLKAITLKFLQFNLTSAGALIIQSIAGPLGTKLIGEQYDFIVLAFVVVFLVLPYNYLMYTKVIWKKKDNNFLMFMVVWWKFCFPQYSHLLPTSLNL